MSRGSLNRLHRPLQVLLAFLAATALIVLQSGVAFSSSSTDPNSIRICHATDSDVNPYNTEYPAKSADAGGHAGHVGPVWHLGLKAAGTAWGDIIPPFDYPGGHFDGLNYGTVGAAFYAHDCQLVVSASLVKTNNADGVAGYHHSEIADSVGASVPFHALITNTGDVAVTIDSLTDAIGTTAVPFTCSPTVVGATLGVGESITCAFTVAGYSPADGASKTNTMRVVVHEGTAAVGENTHNTASDTSTSVVTTTLPPRPDLSLTVVKTNNADGVAGYHATETSAAPNQDVPYRVVITNTSAVTVALDGVTDVLGSAASAPVTCLPALPATLGAGLSATCDFTLTASSPAYDGSITDTATATAHEPGYTSNTASAHDSSTVNTGPAPIVLTPDLSIDKTGPLTAVLPGAAVAYTLTVTNTGNGPASSVIVDDAIPANTALSSIDATGWTCTGTAVHCTLNSTLAAAGTASLTVHVTLDNPYAASTVSNTATVGPTDATPEDNSDTVITNVTHTPDLKIVKTGPEGNLLPGGAADYTLTVTNTGDGPASSVIVDDAIPANTTLSSIDATGWTCTGTGVHCTLNTTLLPAGTATLTVHLTLDNPYAASTVSNTATVGPTDATPEDNSDTVSNDVTHTPDLSIVKTGPLTAVLPGAAVAYTLTVTNDGDAAASSVIVDDAIPANTTLSSISATGWTCSGTAVHCTLDTGLAPAGTASLTVTITLDNPYAASSVVNTATVGPEDATPEDNSSTATTNVTHTPDLSIVKTGPAKVIAGNTLTWTLTVTNDGDAAAATATVTDTIPAGVGAPVVSAAGWTCTGTTTVSCDLNAPLAAGDSASLTIAVAVPLTYPAATVSNTAVVGPTDGTPDDNTSTVVTPVTVFTGGGGSVEPVIGPVVHPVTHPVPQVAKGGGSLAFTGAPITRMLAEGSALLVLGITLMVASRRRSVSWSMGTPRH